MKFDSKKHEIIVGKDGYPIVEKYKIGDLVLDNLTDEIVKIIKITPKLDTIDKLGEKINYDAWKGNWIQLDNNPLDGWRYEWEIMKVRKKYENIN